MKMAIFSLVIVLSVAIMSLFQFEKYQKFSLETHTKISALESQLEAQAEKLQNHVSDIKASIDTALVNNPKLDIPTLSKVEAEHLIRLAEIRFHIDKDVQSTRMLLANAQDKIRLVSDINLNPLREALDKDLATLQNLNLVNTEEIWLKASGIIEKVNQLPLRGARLGTQVSKSKPERDPGLEQYPRWKQALFKSWYEIKDLVKIRHYAKPVEPVVQETEQTLIKENLRLLLEQIRIAILNNQNNVYYQAIQDTQNWLNQYFEESNSNVREIQNILSSMNTLNLKPELPKLMSFEQLTLQRS